MKKMLIIGIALIIIITTGFAWLTYQILIDSGEEALESIEIIEQDKENIVNDGTTEEEEVVGIEIGNIAPNFTLENIYGEEESLEDYRGKNILLNFFSTT